MQRVLITGAASAIAQATARVWAQRGWSFFLLDRDTERLQIVAEDLKVRGAKLVESRAVDLNDFDRHQAIVDQARHVLGEIDIVFVAHGTMVDQAVAQRQRGIMLQEFTTNFLSAASIMTIVAALFEERRLGVIAVISSPAGDRGRQSNYVYGAAKGALTVFVGGLRNRLAKSGVAVITIKPAFVDTPMTAGMKKGFLWVKPDVAARGIVQAIDAKKDIVYVPWFWRWIMLALRLVPERVYKRMSL